jgi:peptidoglycan/xylan/chitin deacetylase (PgdA/CDA1 family)
LYYAGLVASGATAVTRSLRRSGTVLCYHNVVARDTTPVGDPGLHMTSDAFEWQMRWLIAHYDVVPLRTLVGCARAGRSLRSMAAITFDDGYEGVFAHAVPILRMLGIPATVFIVADATDRTTGFWWDQPEIIAMANSDHRDRWLNALQGDTTAILRDADAGADVPAMYRAAGWATLRMHARNGIDLGVHSVSHRSLPTLDDGELHTEVHKSRAMIHRETGIWSDLFAYPYGRCDTRTARCVERAGYCAAFGVGDFTEGDPWCLPRLNIPARISGAAFKAWTAGLHGSRAFVGGIGDAPRRGDA